MEPEVDPDLCDNLVIWSESDGSQGPYGSESLSESNDEDGVSEYRHPISIENTNLGSPEYLQSQECESACEQLSRSPLYKTTVRSLSSDSECLDSEPHTDQISQTVSPSSSSSLGCAGMTLALTLATEQPVGASNRQRRASGFGCKANRRLESSEEGGCCEAPPAPVSFGISDESAEQAEKRNWEPDTDLCRVDRGRTRCTRLRHIESESEKQVKEIKSKCKRIALLLTNAPNPQNKGALLFKKRLQRAKKYTLVSYGTGDYQDQGEEEAEDIGYNLATTSDSELEEDYALYCQQYQFSVNWASFQEMEALPETKGKGVTMFAQRRKRMDDIESEQEELRSKGIPVETMIQPKHTQTKDRYDMKEMYMHTEQADYMDANFEDNVEYHRNIPKTSRPLVQNRTAKPFLGVQENKLKIKVPVPINTTPHVWSPTGDIIASRDERISVPAIRTCILPEPKRKINNKHSAKQQQESNLSLQNKGERRSYIEPEEDFFSLGAEACNFMQPRAIKLKNPPPVAPKPNFNPNCPPWLRSNPSVEPFNPPRSPVSSPSPSPAGPHHQRYRAQAQQNANQSALDQTQGSLQMPANVWTPVNSSPHLQPTTSNWRQQPARSPVSTQALSPSYSPQQPPSSSRNMSESAANSIVSCPPQGGKPYIHESKAPFSLRGQVSGRGISRASDGSTMAGRGAELFAKRQSRMEKFVIDAETVQANKTRSPSPTLSLPVSWRYSSIVRAPPPLSYNPLLSPFYPPAAAKQTPSTSPQIKAKTKQKPKTPPKHLNTLDIMKHQPYQLDTSLFTYDASTEAKSLSPSPSPSPKPSPAPKPKVSKSMRHKSSCSQSPQNASELTVKSEAPAKSSGLVSPKSSSAHQNTRWAEPPSADTHLDEKHTVTSTAHHTPSKQVPSTKAASTSQHLSYGDSIAAAFSPASLIARGARQLAPQPKFSAKKSVGFGRSQSLMQPRRPDSVPAHRPLFAVSTPGSQPSFVPPHRQTSWQEKAFKPPTPWQAASRSPLGSVDEAFVFHSLQSSVASNVKALAQRRSLPEPPDEWKRRVSLDPAAVSKGHFHEAPVFQAPALSRTFSPEKPAFYGPPFRPAQPMRPSNRPTFGYK
ncbi:synaptopodin 2b [Genypterus blacodes]|uniref:synaptopodin 2b n=1 Tax=Genypterus blacodes TaxID=154954 RepID=UPI003F767D09